MTLAQADVEILKLARLLRTDPDEIAYLRDVDWQDIRDVREQASATMFEGDRQQLQRVASATKLVPSKITATIGAHRVRRRVQGLARRARRDHPRPAPARHPAHGVGVRPLARGPRRPAPRVRRAAREAGDIAAAQDDDVLAGLVKAAQRDNLWADVLPVTRAMSEDSRARFAKLKPIQSRPVLSSIVDAASQRGLWPELLTLLPLLPAASRRRVAALGTGFGRSILAQIIRAAHEEDMWAPLLRFAWSSRCARSATPPSSCARPTTRCSTRCTTRWRRHDAIARARRAA